MHYGMLFNGYGNLEMVHKIDWAFLWRESFEHLYEHSPEWGSEDLNYDFKSSENFVANKLTGQFTKEEFSQQLKDFIKNKLKEVSSYPDQAKVGWFLSVMINVLEREQNQDFIIEEILPAIWNDLIEDGLSYQMSDEFNPAILNNLKGSSRENFLKQWKGLMGRVFHEQSLEDSARIIDNHIIHSHLGVYCFEDDRRDMARAFIEEFDIKKIVEIFSKSFGDWEQISMFLSLFNQGTELQKQNLALALYEQITPDKIIKASSDLIDEDMSGFAFRFNVLLIQNLPENTSLLYAENFIYTVGERIVLAFADGEAPYGDYGDIIDSLPEDLARKTVKMLASAALNADYTAQDEDYGSNFGYWYRMRFANDVYAPIPEKYRADFEQTILQYLEQAQPEDKELALIKSAILLRELLTENGDFKTKEVDFYKSPRPDNPYRSAIAHVKPSIEEGRTGIIAVESFLGQLRDFQTQTNPNYSLLGGGSRLSPPHEHEIFPREEYRGFLSPLFAAEHGALLGKEDSVPSLAEALRTRLPHYDRANPSQDLLSCR